MTSARTEREAPFRAIADSTRDWESWVDRKGRLRWSSPAVSRFTGFTPEECMRQHDFPMCVIHEDDRTTMRDVFERAALGASGEDVEFRIVHRDGSLVWASIFFQPLVVGTGAAWGYRTSVRDIHERKEAEARIDEVEREAARAASERARLAASLSHDLRSPLQCILGISELLEQNPLDESKRRWVEIVSEQSTAVVRIVDSLVRTTAGADLPDCPPGAPPFGTGDERRASRPPPDLHTHERGSPPTNPPPAPSLTPVTSRTRVASAVASARGQPSAGSPPASSEPDDAGAAVADGLRVLVVDDSAVARELLVAMLAHLGRTACQAASGEDALRIAADARPNLVLVDYEMPVLDGAETARRLRATRVVEDGALIVLLTAHLETDSLGAPSPEGFDLAMSKPLRLARLRTLLDEAESRALTRERELLDDEVLEDLIAVKDAAGRSLLERRGPALLDALHDAVVRVERAALGTSEDELRKAVHHLVGAAASLGARALSDEARCVERLAAAGAIVGSGAVARLQSKRLRELWTESARAIRALAGFRGGPTPG